MSVRAARIASRVRGCSRTGEGSSEHEPALPVRPVRRASVDAGGSRFGEDRGRAAIRGALGRPKHGEGRLRPEPAPQVKPTRVGLRSRVGEAAPAECGGCFVDLAASSLSRVRADAEGQSNRGAAAAGNGGRRHLASPGPAGFARRWFATEAPRGDASTSGEETRSSREIIPEGGTREAAFAGFARESGGRASGREGFGLPETERRACSETARFQCLTRRSNGDGGGNTAALEPMWLFGCSRSAPAEPRSASAIRRRSHPEEPENGEDELRLFLVVIRLRQSPLLGGVHTGTSEAWRHADDAGWPRRVRAFTEGHARTGCGCRWGHFRSLRCSRRRCAAP